MWIQIETEDEMTRDLAAPTSPSFSLRTSMSQGFCFAPEALPGNRSILKPPGQDRAGSRLASSSETAIECSQLVVGRGVLELEDLQNTSI